MIWNNSSCPEMLRHPSWQFFWVHGEDLKHHFCKVSYSRLFFFNFEKEFSKKITTSTFKNFFFVKKRSSFFPRNKLGGYPDIFFGGGSRLFWVSSRVSAISSPRTKRSFLFRRIILRIRSRKFARPGNKLNSRYLSWKRGDYARVARFFLLRDTQTGKNVPNQHTLCQMVIKYPK
jgi:hypothetical protein